MDKKFDNDVSVLIKKYKAEIEEILIECEHVYRSTIDYELLDSRVIELLEAAKDDGLEEKVIWDLLHSQIPSYVNYINFKITSKKSA